MITQCSIRHLYARKNEPGVEAAIDTAKNFERRRCGHHPDDFPEPLSTLECLTSCVDPKDSGINKFRYIVASNNGEVRAALRGICGVPLVYIKRSVMIMEPMASATSAAKSKEEAAKYKAEIRQPRATRKRQLNDTGDVDESTEPISQGTMRGESAGSRTKKKTYGPKGPNPLSVKKPQKAKPEAPPREGVAEAPSSQSKQDLETPKKKRRRKRRLQTTSGDSANNSGMAEMEEQTA